MTSRMFWSLLSCSWAWFEQVGRREQTARADVAEMALGLGNGVRRVDGRRDAANRGDRVEGDDIFQRVGREDAGDVTLAESKVGQSRRGPLHVTGELAESQHPSARAVDQGRLVGQPRGVPAMRMRSPEPPGSRSSGYGLRKIIGASLSSRDYVARERDW